MIPAVTGRRKRLSRRIVTTLALAALAVALAQPGGGAGAFVAEAPAAEVPAAGIAFASSEFQATEGSGVAEIVIVRNGGSEEAATVHFSTTEGGTALNGIDYEATELDVRFDPGQSMAVAEVRIYDDDLGEDGETVELALSGAAGAPIAAPSTATLEILDDDTGFSLGSNAFYASEGDGLALIAVRRVGISDGAGAVRITSSDASASAGIDYLPLDQIVSFAPGTGSVFVSVPVFDDSANEPDESLRLTLSAPSEGAIVQDPQTSNLTIYDNDKPTVVKKLAGRIFSARLTKSRIAVVEAGLVKLLYSFHPSSERFSYVLSARSEQGGWSLIRRYDKRGVFAGKHAIRLKKVFGPKPVRPGSYRLRLSADRNSKTLRFTIK